jgi:hypothetical protein
MTSLDYGIRGDGGAASTQALPGIATTTSGLLSVLEQLTQTRRSLEGMVTAITGKGDNSPAAMPSETVKTRPAVLVELMHIERALRREAELIQVATKFIQDALG